MMSASLRRGPHRWCKFQLMSTETSSSRLDRFQTRILYLDDHVVLFDKESGMCSVPTRETAVKVQGTGLISSSGVQMPRPRSEQWGEAIRNAKNHETEESVLDVLIRLNEPLESIPRREVQFKRHVGRVTKTRDQSILDKVWSMVIDEDSKLRYPRGFTDNLSDESLSATEVVSALLGKQVFVVHRLDMETSGIMLFARNSSACRSINEQFRLKTIEKKYLAEVDGRWDEIIEKVDLKIRPDLDHRPRQVVDPIDGKECETYVRLRSYKADTNTSILELRPLTGRTHQLRLHTSELGHAILGDSLYASDRVKAMSSRGLRLHAQEISFDHPNTGERIKFESNFCPFCSTAIK